MQTLNILSDVGSTDIFLSSSEPEDGLPISKCLGWSCMAFASAPLDADPQAGPRASSASRVPPESLGEQENAGDASP